MKHNHLRRLATILLLLLPLLLGPHLVYAQTSPPPSTPDDTCFGMIGGSGASPAMGNNAPSASGGLLGTIAKDMQNILNTVSGQMFVGIVGSGSFQMAVSAAVTLYVAIYGLLFMLGMTQISLYDFVVRLVKIAVVVTLFRTDSWYFFSNYVVQFFNGGTDELINVVSAIAVGGTYSGGAPFAAVDNAISQAVSSQMVVTMIATFGTGPNGIIIGLLLVAALGSFMKSVLNALWVYVMSLVLKALLFGLAPIFIACLMFNRTRHLFDGWLNQVINASLQPILLFTFFAFFSALISAALTNIMSTPVCWTEWAESLRGSPFSQHMWRFAIYGDNGWEPYAGGWNFTGATGQANGPVFPIDVLAVLTFLMLAELTGRFNGIVIEIAKDLAGAATNLSGMGGSISQAYAGVRNAMGKSVPLGVDMGNPFGGGGGGGAGGMGMAGTSPNVQSMKDQASPGVGSRGGSNTASYGNVVSTDSSSSPRVPGIGNRGGGNTDGMA